MPQATPGDLPALVQLIAREGEHLSPKPSSQTLLKMILAGRVTFFLGVMIIHQTHAKPKTYGPYRYPAGATYLSHIASTHKGKGHGKKVMLAWLRTQSLVYLNVFASNAPARAFYEALGFQLQGIHHYGGHDVAYYVRQMKPL